MLWSIFITCFLLFLLWQDTINTTTLFVQNMVARFVHVKNKCVIPVNQLTLKYIGATQKMDTLLFLQFGSKLPLPTGCLQQYALMSGTCAHTHTGSSYSPVAASVCWLTSPAVSGDRPPCRVTGAWRWSSLGDRSKQANKRVLATTNAWRRAHTTDRKC